MEHFHEQLTDEGFGEPTRSVYFFWVDRYIIEHKEITREYMEKLVANMVDNRLIHDCHIYDFSADNYLLVCRFKLSLYDVVFFLPTRDGYLGGNKYFLRIKGRIDLVSLRQLFKMFRIKLT